MLQRQQAGALIAARAPDRGKGRVGMVEGTPWRCWPTRKSSSWTRSGRPAMVSKLARCPVRATRSRKPVVNTGTIYQLSKIVASRAAFSRRVCGSKTWRLTPLGLAGQSRPLFQKRLDMVCPNRGASTRPAQLAAADFQSRNRPRVKVSRSEP